jgi:hypothetical protein
VLQHYYASLFNKIVVVNGSSLLTVMSKLAQFFLGDHANGLVFLRSHDEIFKHISRKCVPKIYGGELTDSSGFSGHPCWC